ncbi:MAG TPA: tetratricopeptide repeat protein [Flavobacteriaceae bacterium]|nr:tetratricopeptide repeat protein [Flavobacteriaceae bacterium]HEX5742286.1 tetratricopeptide repeat protein [Flavobacteriaceae bacterium]
MATYKKKVSNKKSGDQSSENIKSTTAEVFNTLDTTASKSEEWIIKHQKNIFIGLTAIVVVILGFMAYQKYVIEPKEIEAADELAFPKKHFEMAVNNEVASDSLFKMSLNGADGKYGFIDIVDNYSGTKAGNLANYYAGIAYLRLKDYKNAISYLNDFKSKDELLAPIAKGAIGDAFTDINQPKDALDYYEKAAELRDNAFTTPFYLFKAANTAYDLGEFEKAVTYFTKIKDAYPNSSEAVNIDLYINKATYASEK